MFDSPFVRRVAISMKLLELPFVHHNWSVGKDQDEIRRYNPLGRVPTLVLADGIVLADSAAILDYLDQHVGPGKALLPASGALRRDTLQLMALATGAAEKGVAQLYEGIFRPAEKQHQPWLARCSEQMHGGLQLLDQHCAQTAGWMIGARMTQADITASTAYSFLQDALGFEQTRYPFLHAFAQRCEALPAFQETRIAFFKPQPLR